MGPDGQLHETRMGNCALAVVEATAHPPRGGNALADGSHSNTLLPIFVDGIIRIIIIFQCLKLCHFEQALHFNCAFVFGGEHILQTRATATETNSLRPHSSCCDLTSLRAESDVS